MDAQLILILVNAGLALVGIFFSIKWGFLKSKFSKIVELANIIMNAIEDDTLSQEELKAIVNKLKELVK